jgi:hypothetical protein
VATVREVAEGLTGICTAVPAAAAGVCPSCHGCPNPGYTRCWSCANVVSQVSRPCHVVVPISLYEIPSQLHHVMRHYKSGTYPADIQRRFTIQLAALIGHFLAEHGDCIERAAGGPWDIITSVPSSGQRAGEHPLTIAIGILPGFRDQYEQLLRKGCVEVGHNRASDEGFIVTRKLHGERVLLIDDTFTTGARAQSAASAINLAGGVVVAILAVGRVVNPHFSETVKEYWDRQRRQPFTFTTCCLE